MFNAIVINKDEAGYRAALTQLDDSALPEGDVTVRVAYSTLNYKDGLAITGRSPVVLSISVPTSLRPIRGLRTMPCGGRKGWLVGGIRWPCDKGGVHRPARPEPDANHHAVRPERQNLGTGGLQPVWPEAWGMARRRSDQRV